MAEHIPTFRYLTEMPPEGAAASTGFRVARVVRWAEFMSVPGRVTCMELSPSLRVVLIVAEDVWFLLASADLSMLYRSAHLDAGAPSWQGGCWMTGQTVLVWSTDGTVYAYDVDIGSAVNPWPDLVPPAAALSTSSRPFIAFPSAVSPFSPTPAASPATSATSIPQVLETASFTAGSPAPEGACAVVLRWTLEKPPSATPVPNVMSRKTPRDGAVFCDGPVIVRTDAAGCVTLLRHPFDATPDQLMGPPFDGVSFSLQRAWADNLPAPAGADQSVRVTATLVTERGGLPYTYFEGLSNGIITTRPVLNLTNDSCRFSGHTGAVTCLLAPTLWPEAHCNELILSGSVDATVRMWNNDSGELEHIFRPHAAPVLCLHQLPERLGTRLHRSVCTIGGDHTVAILSLESKSVTHILGGHEAPVVSVKWRADQRVVIACCGDGSAYSWQLDTGYLDRIVHGAEAKEIMNACDTEAAEVNARGEARAARKRFVQVIPIQCGLAQPPIQVVMIHVKRTISALLASVLGETDLGATPRPGGGESLLADTLHVHFLRLCLSAVLPWGLSETADKMAVEALFLSKCPPNVSLAAPSPGKAMALMPPTLARTDRRWQASSYVNALYSVCSLAISEAFLAMPDISFPGQEAHDAIRDLFCRVLPETVPSFSHPSLPLIAVYCDDYQEPLRKAAQALFKSTVTRMSETDRDRVIDDAARTLADVYKEVPARLVTNVLVLAVLARERPGCLPPDTHRPLRSALLKLAAGATVYATAALTLLGEVFSQLRGPADEVHEDLVASLLDLALRSTSPHISSAASGALTRIAISAPADYVGILGTRVVTLKSAISEKRQALTHLMTSVKSSASILINELPHLVEVLVRCLDPNLKTERDELFTTTKEYLNTLVKRYPMVDFNNATQRLAAAVPDDKVIIVFDLKTATRLMALQGHTGGVSALSFYESGGMLASLSLVDNTLRIWELSSGFFGVFASSGKCTKSFELTPLPVSMPLATALKSTRVRWLTAKDVEVKRGSDNVANFPLKR